LGLRRVSAAGVDFGPGMALVPQPGRAVPDSDAGGDSPCCCYRCPILSLWHVWDVRGAIRAGGALGELLSGGLRSGFNLWGANLVAVALLVTRCS